MLRKIQKLLGNRARRGGGSRMVRAASLAVALFTTAANPHPAAAQSESSAGALNLIRDTEIEETLHADVDGVLRAAGLDPKAVQIHVIGQNQLNAFVSGGQHLFLYTGLIEQTNGPNQLIGVMAHETGHMAGGHLARSGDMERAGLAPMALSMGLGVLAALAGRPDAAASLVMSSSYFGELNVLDYSREQEARADQAGVTYLEGAHQSAYGLVQFFDNFRYQEVFDESRRFPFFRSHPLSSDRIEALRVRAQAQSHYQVVDSPEAIARHEIMIAKLRGFMDPPEQTLGKYPEGDTSLPARYARTIAYYKAGKSEIALKLVDELLEGEPNNPYFWELKGQMLFDFGRAAEAAQAHARSVELKPEAPLLRINLAQALLAENAAKNADAAIDQLRRAVAVEADNSFAWQLMAQAYDAKNEPGKARLAAAEEFFALGDDAQAKVFAVRALGLLSKKSADWRRATDIVFASHPNKDDLKAMNDAG
jgi:predicted Zn-dependent protease